MAKFKVAITLTETQIFIIEADNNTEVIEKISDVWDNWEIVLDNPELSDTDFSLIGRA